jgi:hypothetical protein
MTQAAASAAANDDIDALGERVARGMDWLTEHDPDGSYHHWFEAGLIPLSPMPAQSPERIAAWRDYYRQRVRWERMWKDLERLERKVK